MFERELHLELDTARQIVEDLDGLIQVIGSLNEANFRLTLCVLSRVHPEVSDAHKLAECRLRFEKALLDIPLQQVGRVSQLLRALKPLEEFQDDFVFVRRMSLGELVSEEASPEDSLEILSVLKQSLRERLLEPRL